MVLHLGILYIPFLQGLFSIEPLKWPEWQAVLLISLPVIFIDEGLKYLERLIYIQPATHLAPGNVEVSSSEANGKPSKETNGKVKAH